MKKFVLAVVGMMTVLGLFAYETWTDPKTGIEWKYEVIGDEVSIGGGDYSNTAVPASRSGVLLVPSEISGKRVTSLGSFAFYCCDKLTSVTIPESVTVIGEYAFLGCSGLTSVTIPSSIARIGGWAFYGCSGLGDGVVVVDGCVLTVNGECPSVIVLQNDVRLIADYVFSGFSNLTSITIPKGATSIGESAFSDCSELTSITIPEGVASIGASAFSDCSGLTSVRIPSSVTSIGRNAFYGCPITMAEVPGHTCGMDFSNVTNLVVSEGTTNIAEWAFGRCRSLVSATIPPSVTSIGAGAFDGCSGLTSVTIPEGVTVIGQDAFWGCSGLTSVTIPSSVTSIGRDAFYGCPITTAEVPGHTCGIDFSNVTNLVVSDGTTNIAERAFAGSRSLVSVTIPSSVTSIGAGAFADCVGLESVVIPSSVTSFGSLILEGCEAVTDLTLPGFIQLDDVGYFPELRCLTVADGTVEICQGFAFDYQSLTRVEIPASVRKISTAESRGGEGCIGCGEVSSRSIGAFDGCSSIVSVQISEAVSSMSDVFPDSYMSITEVSVVEGAKTLGEGLFSGCYSLESIQLPSTLQSIADNAFGMCFALTKIDVSPDNPNFMVQGGALYQSRVYIPIGWEVIAQEEKRLVLVASNVTRLEIPDGVGSISGGAFSCCGGIFGDGNGLKELIVPDSVTEWRTYSVQGDQWGDSAIQCLSVFTGCGSLEKVRIPGAFLFSTNILGDYEEYSISDIFPNHEKLKSVIIGPGQFVVRTNTFEGCLALQSLVLPETVREVESRAFSDCYNLKSVQFMGDAPDVGENAFVGTPQRLVVSVPEGSIGWDPDDWLSIPSSWQGRAIVLSGESYDWGGGTRGGNGGHGTSGGTGSSDTIHLITTNVVVHYIVNSVQPERAIPATMDTGFVNIITEVKSGGAVSVPETWSQNYPDFTAKFGSDFTKALMKTTGKVDGAGNPMMVWQDYVAGTDPTKVDDVFRASVTMVDGNPVVSCTPELTEAEKALRKYTTWGKVKLQDETWLEVPDGHEADYNFFKVTVEMR